MIYFRSDYSQGAHPRILDALIKTNEEHTNGYAMDEHSYHAAEMIKELIGRVLTIRNVCGKLRPLLMKRMNLQIQAMERTGMMVK